MIFSTTNRHWPRNPAVFWGIPGVGCVTVGKLGLTNGFSQKVENHRAAVALHFAHYNLVQIHSSIRCTPAMAAGVTPHLWTLEELVARTSN